MDGRANKALQDLFSRTSTSPANADNIGNIYSNQNSSSAQLLSNDETSYEGGRQTPLMPGSLHDDQAVSPSSSNMDRQSALLSLLSGSGNSSAPRPPHQSSTPPSSMQSGSSPSHNEAQGKLLLEQLMAGNPSRSVRSDSNDVTSSPPYGPPMPEPGEYHRPTHSHEASLDLGSQSLPAQAQQQPASDKSIFDFVSPFDALSNSSPVGSANSGSGSIKPKPIPQASHPDVSYPAPDPRRASVDNLLESLTRAPAPPGPSGTPPHQVPQSYDPYPQPEYGSPSQRKLPSPAMGSPQKQARGPPENINIVRRNGDSPASVQGQSIRRDVKDSSPIPMQASGRASLRGKKKNQNASSPAPQPQNIIFDVAQSLPGIQAPSDYVKSTAIALVRQDSVFLPGTTIGATSWVAYAMTRGRVRVISRSSGDRTLLQLPAMFPQSSTVVDMATYRNRLAGVTSDGGFVVWELPETITDDVPGRIMLCVQPPQLESDRDPPLHMAKWHPQDPDTLAVASESKVYLINLSSVAVLHGQSVRQYELNHVSHVFNIPTPLVAFDFDVVHYALATISEDSTLTLWNIHDGLPYTEHKVRGEDVPSSITFVDGGVVVGRKNGTIFQLLNMTTKAVLSTIKFINSSVSEDPDMFGHAHYDARIGTLWIANCRRDSMIAFKLNFDNYSSDPSVANYVDQVVEFAGPKPTIHFVILTADADPTGDEAQAACVAAKVPPGDLALVAFSVHAGGVDQILIRKEWFESALMETSEKVPSGYDASPSLQTSTFSQSGSSHQRTSFPEEEAEADSSNREEQVTGNSSTDRQERGREPKGKGKRNVNWKGDKDNSNENNTNPGGNKGGNRDSKDSPILSETAFAQALNREMKKTEDSLHTKIGRLLGKELDKQNQRLEDARAHDMQQDFARQETLLKVISNELTKNTTRVVESAVRNVISTNVLPSLEQITKQEVSNALNAHVGQGITNFVTQNLPREMEKLMMRPDISSNFTQLFAAQIAPTIERQVRDAVNKTFMPTYTQQSNAMHQELLTNIHNVKTELMAWQSEALRSHEAIIKELQHNVSVLSDQVKYLSSGATNQNLPNPNVPPMNMNPPYMGPPPPPGANFPSGPLPFGPAPPAQGAPPGWFNSTIAAPQASHPATIPQPPPPPQAEPSQASQPSGRTPPYNNKPQEPWDNVFLDVLQTQDRGKLSNLLKSTSPDEILPLNAPTAVSQAVILTLVHRLSAVVGELSPTDEEFKSSIYWLRRCIFVLRPQDKIIADFIPRTIPTVHQWLNQAKQRCTILPNAPGNFEASRMLTEMQDELVRRGARSN